MGHVLRFYIMYFSLHIINLAVLQAHILPHLASEFINFTKFLCEKRILSESKHSIQNSISPSRYNGSVKPSAVISRAEIFRFSLYFKKKKKKMCTQNHNHFELNGTFGQLWAKSHVNVCLLLTADGANIISCKNNKR